MAAQVDVKRYQIISLLYIIFICFSVLNIKVSLLDSNTYAIKSFESIEEDVQKKITISKLIVANNDAKLSQSPKAKSYLLISDRLSKSHMVISSMIEKVHVDLKKMNETIYTQFNNRNKTEKILKSEGGLDVLEKDMFELTDYINKSPFKISTKLIELVPINKEVITLKGKKTKWEDYLFIHKPTAISFMQLVRIRLLILQTQLEYQEAALSEIGYLPTYFSKMDEKLYVLKSSVKEYSEDQIIKPGQKVISVNDQVFDDLFQKILRSLRTENIFVGLNSTVLNEFGFQMGKDFDVEIEPSVPIKKVNDSYTVLFNKSGEYTFKFFDLRKGSKKILFDKQIRVNPLPEPVVKVKGDNLNRYSISVKDLLSAERLEGLLNINNLTYFPGRINSYKVIRVHNGKEEESVSNYGELFQSPTQKVMSALKKNDFLIFDNINIALVDGSTRLPAPIIYKITD